MTVTTHATREDKLNWLMRPFDWASNVCLYLFICCGALWYFADTLTPSEICIVLLCGIGAVFGLLIWGMARVSNAARGRI